MRCIGQTKIGENCLHAFACLYFQEFVMIFIKYAAYNCIVIRLRVYIAYNRLAVRLLTVDYSCEFWILQTDFLC